ncbi:MAG: 3-phosphoshikimate 1-carboxyvinyltransferase [Rhodothermales bacterium]
MSTKDDVRTVQPAGMLSGTVDLPADKSIAHRTALLSALADGTSRIVNYPASEDPQSTLSCLRQLGVRVEQEDEALRVEGGRLAAPGAPLDCGNSGTTMRLLAGILSGQPFPSELTGDASLSARPMGRVMAPLSEMGARISASDGRAPLHIAPTDALHGIVYRLPVASAQVKSAVLLAGLFAEGETTVIEPVATRDHTERMLGLSSVVLDGERHITVEGGMRIAPRLWTVPRDFSAAAFFMVAGSIVESGLLRLPGTGLNPTRTALLDVLRAMGADIRIENERTTGGEPIGDLVVRSAALSGVQVSGPVIANMIDELPVLALAAACADGVSEIRGAGELRHKETDRIAAVADGLRALGARVTEHEDGWTIQGGGRLTGGRVDAFGDHRIAMTMGVAGLVASGPVHVHGASVAAVSFPTFWEDLARISG